MENNSDNGWPLAKLSFEASKFATEFCIMGNAIACSVCCEHDESLRDFGVILSRKPFTIGNFNEHCIDGVNVSNVYKIKPIANIKRLLFKVDLNEVNL